VSGRRPTDDWNKLDVPGLRGISKTAPYFHNNSAATLEEVVDHYTAHFNRGTDQCEGRRRTRSQAPTGDLHGRRERGPSGDPGRNTGAARLPAKTLNDVRMKNLGRWSLAVAVVGGFRLGLLSHPTGARACREQQAIGHG